MEIKNLNSITIKIFSVCLLVLYSFPILIESSIISRQNQPENISESIANYANPINIPSDSSLSKELISEFGNFAENDQHVGLEALDQRILDQDNSIEVDEKEKSSNKSDDKRRHLPPIYLQLIYQELEQEGDKQVRGHTETRDEPLLRAWLPVNINREKGAIVSGVEFQSVYYKNKLTDFIDAQLILTLRDGINLGSKQPVLNMFIKHQENQEEKHSVIMKNSERFYTFNITPFLHSKLNENSTNENLIINFNIYEIFGRTIQLIFLEDVFDVQVERPFILIQYKSMSDRLINLGNNSVLTQQYSSRGRIRRSIVPPTRIANATGITISNLSNWTQSSNITESTIPANLCSRYENMVRPIEIGWRNVISPEFLDLGYCSGSCPFPLESDHFNFTIHSFFLDRQRMSRAFRLPPNFPHTTCVAVTYKSLIVIEEESEGGYAMNRYHDISADQCGCR